MLIKVFLAGLYFYLVSCLSHDTISFSDLVIATNMFYSRCGKLDYICVLVGIRCLVCHVVEL